jgi:hypothetical protein
VGWGEDRRCCALALQGHVCTAEGGGGQQRPCPGGGLNLPLSHLILNPQPSPFRNTHIAGEEGEPDSEHHRQPHIETAPRRQKPHPNPPPCAVMRRPL